MAAPRAAAAFAVTARSAVAVAAALRSPVVTAEPSLKDELSGIFGSVSLTAWICLLLPQLIQNYKSQSAEGLSMAFLFVWLLGDVTNLSGALWTGLAPTAVALACYFCIADLVLITQCLYYNAKTARRDRLLRQTRTRRRSSSTAVAEDGDSGESEEVFRDGDDDEDDSPLLARRRSSSLGLPGSHRHHSMRRSESNLDPLRRIITGEDDAPDSHPWLNNTLSLLAVWVVGTVGYFASYHIGAWDVADPVDGGPGGDDSSSVSPDDIYATIGLALGYFSAVCYLCARIPQIIKNYREKSCEGLALLFFLLSLTGNFTYGASLVAYSQDGKYLIKALPWLLGSLGTIVEDLIIFFQFRIYAPKRNLNKPTNNTTANGNSTGTYGTV